jgi:uncharacterized membrane protein YbaN (DUF454 family)
MKYRYLFLIVGIIMIVLFKEIGVIFALFMLLAFIFDAFFSKSYKPWKRVNNKEDYSKKQRMKIDEIDSLKK